MDGTILLVEDEADVRMLTRMWLESLGYRVVEADDGAVAWDLMRQDVPDLVLTDIAMPNRDGVQLCRLIKTTEATADVPVLMFTSHTEVESQVASTDAGADAYIPKDSSHRIMQGRIEALLRARTRQSEATRKEIASAQRQTLSQTVITLAHHINNSLMAIHATASVVDPECPDEAKRLQSVCRTEVRKMFKVLTALKAMADEQELKTTTYVGPELMFDLSDRT